MEHWPIRIFIVDDQQINIESLKLLFSPHTDEFQVVGTALSGEDAINAIKKNSDVDLILLDYKMRAKNGLETLDALMNKNTFPKAQYKVVMLSIIEDLGISLEAIKRGASGYILRETPFESMMEALKTIHLDPDRVYLDSRKGKSAALLILSKTERDICHLVLEEHTADEIAQKLRLDVEMVNDTLKDLRQRANAKNTPHLAYYLLENGLCNQVKYRRPGSQPKIILSKIPHRKTIPIFIVESDTLTSQGLSLLFERSNGIHFKVQAIFKQSEALIAHWEQIPPSPNDPPLVLMDLEMEGMGGLSGTYSITQQYPFVKVIILTVLDSYNKGVECIEAGAMAYATKGISLENLLNLVLAVDNGLDGHIGVNYPKIEVKFSDEDKRIIQYICQGMTDEEIASKIGKTSKEIEGRRNALRRKIGCKKTVGIVTFAWLNRLSD